MSIYRILSVLLHYPQQELLDAVVDIRTMLKEMPLSTRDSDVLENFLQRLESKELTTLQEEYVQTFDLVPEHSLHLTHHLFGDERGRGPALIDLTEYYKEFGLQADEKELPDYLPMILEFSSELDETEAHLFLSQTVKVLQQLAVNLEKVGSPYAALVRVVESKGQLAPIAA
ncbi:MAG: nitrate reductase molybdenum cofactor assembly chaperone [Gammaproteobacteria bacterium]|nr:nitrate reductase molybdenum cofactor assembly chaperone [Gammaproteobacteria bacterium]MDH5802088.1 nitrate reductase molybdenum cofactor assembly chaperone [Gammaproteobacteria bacterium]